MNKKNNQAELSNLLKSLKNVIISEKDVEVEVQKGLGSGFDVFRPGIVVFNYAGGYNENYSMVKGGMSIGLHSRVMESDTEPIIIDSVKSSDFKNLFRNGYTVGNGRDSADIISTEKIYLAALVVADFLSGIEKETNQELGRKSKKAGVDFYLSKIIGLEEATELMQRLKKIPDGSASGLYSKDNITSAKAWYVNKELIESFWIFGKDRRADLFERRTGVKIPSSNKEMPLLKAEIIRLLTPNNTFESNIKSTLIGDVVDFDRIKRIMKF